MGTMHIIVGKGVVNLHIHAKIVLICVQWTCESKRSYVVFVIMSDLEYGVACFLDELNTRSTCHGWTFFNTKDSLNALC